jgi:hypothetical protein
VLSGARVASASARRVGELRRRRRAPDTSRRTWRLGTGLHQHHTGEDELMWPLLLERAPANAVLILRVEEQHERIAELTKRSGARRSRHSASPGGRPGKTSRVEQCRHHRGRVCRTVTEESGSSES